MRVFVSAKSLALRCELKGLRTGCVDLVFVIRGLVIAVAAGGLVVWQAKSVHAGKSRAEEMLTDSSHVDSANLRNGR